VTSRKPLDPDRGAREIRESISEGSKLRRGRNIDLSHEHHQIHTWDRASGFHGLNSHEYSNRNHENHDTRYPND
jgi:hypothetical protein